MGPIAPYKNLVALISGAEFHYRLVIADKIPAVEIQRAGKPQTFAMKRDHVFVGKTEFSARLYRPFDIIARLPALNAPQNAFLHPEPAHLVGFFYDLLRRHRVERKSAE